MRTTMILSAMSLLGLIAGQAQAQDAAAGEKVFVKCKACHFADQDKNKIGPSLHGVVGRTAGTHPGYSYSPAMVAAGKGGLVWTEEELAKYLHDPKATIKGNKMAFVGLKQDADVANVIAYLKQESQ
ncbi:cytochrome c family protein [Mesorhizobium sp. SP-1A]|uniref:c-type cytochrome n=1 Tax=Mesorhizobium sp. SP-1A TaxID=3077840 RepID=UPI0028F6C477|nr:cytochrome c family protein [Mesorhizobium sp. SP-1A]